MSNIYLLRHTEKFKPARKSDESYSQFTGRIGLSDFGREQANGLGKNFSENYNFQYIFTSDFRRTRETAEIICKYTKSEIKIDKRLNERILCVDGIENNEVAKYRQLTHSDWGYSAPGGESMNAVADRVKAVIDEIRNTYNNDEDIFVISHARTIQAYMHRYSQNKTKDFRSENTIVEYGELFKI